MFRDAVFVHNIQQRQADHVGVFRLIAPIRQDFAGAYILPKPRFRADNVAVMPAHEDVVPVAVAVDPLHCLNAGNGTDERWIHAAQRISAIS